MKEIRIFLASSYELEPDRARIGDLIRRLNDKYEARHIYLKLEKWEDVESFYNGNSKQGEYDHLIRQSRLFVGLFWHCAGMYTVHEVDVAQANLPPENILIFRKTAQFREDHEGSEDVKRFRERFPEKELFKTETEMDKYLAKQETVFQYKIFPELGDILSKKIEDYCASVTVTEEEKARTYSRNTLQIHVAASPEVEPDAARLGDLVRYLDENSRYYCRIKMIDALPGSDMFVSMCHTSAPVELRNEIDAAVRANRDSANKGKPRLFFCMKYLESGTPKDPSLEELEKQFSSVLSHYPDQYAHAPELKLHFMLQLERLQKESAHSDAMLVVKDGVIYQKNGETESPLMSCEDMGSLRKDDAYREMKQHLSKLKSDLEKLKERDRNSEQDLSKEIHRLYQEITEVEDRIRDKQNGYLRLARTLEEMVGQVQDDMIQSVRELFQDGKVDEALKLLPAPDDQRQEREERKRRHEEEDLRAYNVCNLTIDCLQAGNALKNRESIFDLYELLIDIADDLRDEEKKGEACFKYANRLMNFCFYDKAMEYYEKALAIRLHILGEDHPDVAACYGNIGLVLGKKGDHDKALEHHEKALAIYLQTFGEDYPYVATCYNNIGLVWDNKGIFNKALEHHEKALAIRLRTLGEDHPYVTDCYNNVGNVWAKKGNYNKALEYFEKALAIRLRVFGEDHQDVASCYNNIGLICYNKGDFNKAKKYLEKALAIHLRTLGEDHQDVAGCYNNLGLVCYNKGDFSKALEYHEKALAIRLRLFGEDHQDVAGSYNNLGLVWSMIDMDAQAFDCFEKSLAISLRSSGEDHPDVAVSRLGIGKLWLKRCNKDKALSCFESALKIYLHFFGKNHQDVAGCLLNIGKTWLINGDDDKAWEYFKKALMIFLHLGKDHPNVAECYICIANLFLKNDKQDKAMKYSGKALEILLHAVGERHPDLIQCYTTLGSISLVNCDYAKALEYFDKALTIRFQALDENHPDVAFCCFLKGITLINDNHQDEGEECMKKAIEIARKFPENEMCKKILEDLSGEDEQ